MLKKFVSYSLIMILPGLIFMGGTGFCDEKPELFLSFSRIIYRSNARAASFLNLRGKLSGRKDIYVAVTCDTDGDGKKETYFADSAGNLRTEPVAGIKGAELSGPQMPLGFLRQPAFAKGSSHIVKWTAYAVAEGSQPKSISELNDLNKFDAIPVTLRVAGAPHGKWSSFCVLQAMFLKSGIRIFAEIKNSGKEFEFYAGEDAAERLWALEGPKLILISGLGCSATSWAGGFENFVVTGKPKLNDGNITNCPDLMKNYRYVAFFEYKSSEAVDGPEISGAFVKAMRGARPEDRIDIISHSMGGVVTRYYVERCGGHKVIDNAVLMQSPLNGVTSPAYSSIASIIPVEGLNGAMSSISPVAKLLKGSELYRKLNDPWLNGDKLAGKKGYGSCHYFCVAGGVFGSGTDPHSTKGWFDNQSEFFPDEIKAESALWLPLGGGKVGELDPTGKYEILLTSASKKQDRCIGHAPFVGHMTGKNGNGSDRWIIERLWPDKNAE